MYPLPFSAAMYICAVLVEQTVTAITNKEIERFDA